MLELKKAGLYIANGKSISVLIRVVGELPCLNIVSGVLLNDMEKDGTITALTTDSLEIQDIICNPKNYIFDTPSVSDVVSNEEGLNAKASKYAEFEETKFNEWLEKYVVNKSMYLKDYYVKTQAMLIREGYSKSQTDSIIEQMERRLRYQRTIG